MRSLDVPNRLPIASEDPPGMDCFGEDRDALNDQAKYFNNAHLSDVTIVIGDETFLAHRLILAKSSDVFDRMLCQRWNGDKKELEMVEEAGCQKVFSSFLRFLYCNHVVLHQDNCLPILILADKYNVNSLKKVCIKHAMGEIVPTLPLKEVFSVWFSYSTKAYHQLSIYDLSNIMTLIKACVSRLAFEMDSVLSPEWESLWMSLDRDQLIEILRCNQLQIANEYKLWEAVSNWLQAKSHPERRGATATPLLSQILPLVRFPYMTADELSQVEQSPVAVAYPKLFHPLILLAYKWQALPLASRTKAENQKEFSSTQFVLRRYHDDRWFKSMSVCNEQLFGKDYPFQFKTRSSTLNPDQTWQWTLKLCGSSYCNQSDDCLKVFLVSEDIDSPRSIEYMLSIVDEKKVLKSFVGKKNFTKTRYSSELDMDRRVEMGDLLTGESSLLVNGELHLQLVLKPID